MKKYFILALLAVALAVPSGLFAANNWGMCISLTSNLKPFSTDSQNGGQVSMLQNFLKSRGYLSPTAPNGYFGTMTVSALKNFQKANGISSENLVGPQTIAKISALTCTNNVSPGTLCPNGLTLASNCALAPNTLTVPLCPNGLTLASNCVTAPTVSNTSASTTVSIIPVFTALIPASTNTQTSATVTAPTVATQAANTTMSTMNRYVPYGVLDGVTADGIAYGWAVDQDAVSQAIGVHFYIDAGASTYIGPAIANLPSPDVASGFPQYPGNHRFQFTIPSVYWKNDGLTHTIFAYGIDSAGANNSLLANSPKTFILRAVSTLTTPVTSTLAPTLAPTYIPTQTPTPGPIAPLTPPTNLTASCPTPGTNATLSWSPAAGVSAYYLRVFDSTLYPNRIPGQAGDFVFYNDNVTATSQRFTATPGHSYIWWIHSRNPVTGAPSTYVQSSVTCAVTASASTLTLTPTLTPTPTVAPVPTITYVASPIPAGGVLTVMGTNLGSALYIDGAMYASGLTPTINNTNVNVTLPGSIQPGTHTVQVANSAGRSTTQKFNISPTTKYAPVGTLDGIAMPQGFAYGWAVDQDDVTKPLRVDFYVDAPVGNTAAFAGSLTANLASTDVTNAYPQYPGSHRFQFTIPNKYRGTGLSHTIYAYAIDLTSGYSMLIGSPKTFVVNTLATASVLDAFANQNNVNAPTSDLTAIANSASSCLVLSSDLQYPNTDAVSAGAVSKLQGFLNSQNYLVSSPTGNFGSQTYAAVKAFQSANGITDSGYVGVITRAKIQEVSCK